MGENDFVAPSLKRSVTERSLRAVANGVRAAVRWFGKGKWVNTGELPRPGSSLSLGNPKRLDTATSILPQRQSERSVTAASAGTGLGSGEVKVSEVKYADFDYMLQKAGSKYILIEFYS